MTRKYVAYQGRLQFFSQSLFFTVTGVLLIAGGIGITPVRVMFAECLQRGYPVTVLYTFREERDAAFLEEFKAVSMIFPEYI